MATVSLVLPAYNEEAMLEKTAVTLKKVLSNAKISYQLIFVDDGSKDSTWKKIEMAA